MNETGSAFEVRRILILSDCYLPATTSAARLIHDLACGLRDRGLDVTVLAPDPGITAELQEEDGGGFRVLRVRSAGIKGAGNWRRGWEEARLAARIWSAAGRRLRGLPHQGIVYYSPTIFLSPLVERLKRLWGARSYLILRDIFPQWAIDAGVLRHGPVTWWLERVARRHYRSADVIGVQTAGNIGYFQARYPDLLPRIEVLPNWMSPTSAASMRRGEGRSDGPVTLFYGGNIGVAQDMDNVMRLAAALHDWPRVRISLVGGGTEVERLRAAAAFRGLTSVDIPGPQSQERYRELLAEADVGLITLGRKLTTHNFPGKALGYMNEAIPILASVNPGNDFCAELAEAGAALVSVNGDIAAFLAHARMLIDNPGLRQRMGQAGRKLLEGRFSTTAVACQVHLGLAGSGKAVAAIVNKTPA